MIEIVTKQLLYLKILYLAGYCKRRGGGTIADHDLLVVESYDGKRRMRLTRCFW